MSSSAIGFTTLTYGPTGPTGNVGNRGLIGPDGPTSGNTGPRGSLSPNIADIQFNISGASVFMSDGTVFSTNGSFKGATITETSSVETVDYLDPLIDSTTFSFISSGEGTDTFILRGLSANGSLIITEDSQAIYIDSIYTPGSGSADSISLTDNTLIFLKKANQIASTTIGVTYGTFYDGTLNFEKNSGTPSFSKILPRAKLKYIQPIFKTENSQPVTLNVNDAGIFYIRTPNGISAFSGDFKNNEVVSFTLITESDDIWNFPDNVYFESGENYLTCGKSILNLTTFDQGSSWYATVTARGIDTTVEACQNRSLFGSCCYDGITGIQCKDFSTKNECDVLSGTFNPLQSCQSSCGVTFGVCCSNGHCIENTTIAECTAFGGTYLIGQKCNSFGASTDPSATNEFRLCYDKCQNQKVACCKDGSCIGDEFTKIQCENINGGVAFVGKSCSEIDCCIQNVKIGACCRLGECSQATLTECRNAGGVFMGEGEMCDSVNCGCFPDAGAPLGTCCTCSVNNSGVPQFVCVVSTQASCTNGTWEAAGPGVVLTPGGGCPSQSFTRCANLAQQFNCVEEQGACCFCSSDFSNAVTCAFMPRSQCMLLHGKFTANTTCSNITCNPCDTSCSDCHVPTPGVKCKCNSGVRQCTEVADITTDSDCFANTGFSCSSTSTTCSTSPCDVIIPECFAQTCISPPVPENVDCPGTSSINQTCESCFSGSIPQGSGEISLRYFDSLTSEAIYNRLTGVNKKFPGVLGGNICPESTSPSQFKNRYGTDVKDYYIPIKSSYIVNGTDLKLCIDIEMANPSFGITFDSMRAYVLRTWYPNYYSTNYAAFLGLTLSDGTSVQFVDPRSTQEEFSVWGSLGRLSNISGDQTKFLSAEEYYSNLSSVMLEDGFSYIESNIDPTIPSDILKQFNINTVEMIHELNCPLIGYNPRGRYAGHINSTNTSISAEPSTCSPGTCEPDPATLSDPGIAYAGRDDFTNPFYYQSVNIGGRFGLTESTMSANGDASNQNRITDQPYITIDGTQSFRGELYFSKMLGLSDTVGITLSTKRTIGYTDYGYVNECPLSGFGGQTSKITYTPLNLFDADGINSIGYYVKYTSLHRFANKFINRRLLSVDQNGANILAAEKLLPYGFSYPGNPITVDHQSSLITIGAGNLFDPKRDILRYDDIPTQPRPVETSIGINRSPIYKTRHTSIICDTGVITKDGYTIEDSNKENFFQNGNSVKIPFTKKKYIGAIDNPFLQQNAKKPTSIISKTDTGIRICLKIPNFKNYILTDDQLITSGTANGKYNELKDTRILQNKKFLNYLNSLRVVIFSNPYNPFSDNLTFDVSTSGNIFGDLIDNSGKYVTQTVINSTSEIQHSTFRYGCTNVKCSAADSTQNGSCHSCEITPEDKQTNGWGFGELSTIACLIEGGPFISTQGRCCNVTVITSGEFGNGPASLLACRCGTQEFNCPSTPGNVGVSGIFNCRNCTHNSPCSAKTSSHTMNFATQAIIGECGANLPECPIATCNSVGPCTSCPTGCNLSGIYKTNTPAAAIQIARIRIEEFFNSFGYIKNVDYFEVSLPSNIIGYFWKLSPRITILDSTRLEKYSFPVLSPPIFALNNFTQANYDAYYYRDIICGTSTALPQALLSCGVNTDLFSNIQCKNYCDITGDIATNIILGDQNTQVFTDFIRNQGLHVIDGYLGTPLDGIYGPQDLEVNIGSPCPTSGDFPGFIGNAFKKLFISEDQFICVQMDCTSIDCSQYQDCVP